MRRVWHLNFDADDELALARGPANGPRPSGRATAQHEQRLLRLRLAVSALVGRDELFDETGIVSHPEGMVGYTFMPTPRALETLARAGVRTKKAPSLEVLRRANDRALSSALGVALPGATYVTDLADAAAAVARVSVTGTWLLKRSFGFAGRGSKRVTSGEWPGDVSAFVRNSLERGGGLEITPWVSRSSDFALHGFLTEAGTYVEGTPTRQHCDRFGQWERTSRASVGPEGELSEVEAEALSLALREAAVSLRSVGYFGPFGIDGFRYALPDGSVHFCPRCEINARYTMGWAIGMGDLRPDLTDEEAGA